MATVRSFYRTTARWLRNREWVGTVAVITAAVTAAIEYLDIASTTAESLTGDETIAQVIVVVVGIWRARAGVNSNDTLADEIEWARRAERDKPTDPV